MKASYPIEEKKRLQALREYDVLDTLPEQAYDDITFVASQICGAPIALMSLVDEERQWFKSTHGLDLDSTSRDVSFCAHAILDPQKILIVEDATKDARFFDNALVHGEAHIRFYAGAPLVTGKGEALGTLCVIDKVPRELTDAQKKSLAALARQVMAQLELRQKIVELQQAEQKLRSTEKRFNTFMDNSPAVCYMKEEDGRFVYANDAFLSRFELTREELLGQTDMDLWPEPAIAIRQHDLKVMRGTEALRIEENVPTPDGRSEHWLAIKFPLRDGEKRLLGGVSIDITDRKHYELQLRNYQEMLEESVERLREMSVTDALTGLHNRGGFEERLSNAVSHAKRTGRPLSMLMLDVDFFKTYNDGFGHLAGDDVLRSVAQIIRDNARPHDFLARYGGEEFSLLLVDTDLEAACKVAERLRESVSETPQRFRQVTASIGVATLNNPQCNEKEAERVLDGKTLVEAADQSLYLAKNSGRNKVVCHCDAFSADETPVLISAHD